MEAIESKIDTGSDDFKINMEHYKIMMADLQEKLEEVKQGGSEDAVRKHRERDKMMPRERIEAAVSTLVG